MSNTKGLFIVFEGIDGSGKTTQINLLKKHFEECSQKCFETREPSDGPVGSLIRQFLSGRMKADERTLAALFAADRLDHIFNETTGLKPKLDNGINVISDRYILSTYAYQSVRVPLDWVMQLNSVASEELKPDCHIFIDVEPEITLKRMAEGRFHSDLFENKQRLTEVRSRYLELIAKLKEKENIIIIDGNQSIEKISDDIWNEVKTLLL